MAGPTGTYYSGGQMKDYADLGGYGGAVMGTFADSNSNNNAVKGAYSVIPTSSLVAGYADSTNRQRYVDQATTNAKTQVENQLGAASRKAAQQGRRFITTPMQAIGAAANIAAAGTTAGWQADDEAFKRKYAMAQLAGQDNQFNLQNAEMQNRYNLGWAELNKKYDKSAISTGTRRDGSAVGSYGQSLKGTGIGAHYGGVGLSESSYASDPSNDLSSSGGYAPYTSSVTPGTVARRSSKSITGMF